MLKADGEVESRTRVLTSLLVCIRRQLDRDERLKTPFGVSRARRNPVERRVTRCVPYDLRQADERLAAIEADGLEILDT